MTESADAVMNVLGKAVNREEGVLSACVGVDRGTHLLNRELELVLGLMGCSFEEDVL